MSYFKNWNDQTLFEIDGELANRGIPFHARCFHVTQALIKDGVSLSFGDKSPEEEAIAKRYNELFPEYSSMSFGGGIGIICSVDRVKKVILPVVFGTIRLNTHQICGMRSEKELLDFCRQDEKIIQSVISQSKCIWSISRGPQRLSNEKAKLYFSKSQSYLNSIGDNLAGSYFVGFSSSEIWLAFEFAAKAFLIEMGLDDNKIKKLDHYRKRILEVLRLKLNSEDFNNLSKATKMLPEYNKSRYFPEELLRMDVISMALGAQAAVAIISEASWRPGLEPTFLDFG
ncbi:hypothetical protein GE300_22050 [Rhodobacteraceae bacterium 2CG4]|uniref:HEPN domain-containing protein n=1 Tax=Halovulum marinum TaxID=2662447 RepID=A0A6L5Z877_9RHOB|nr:hypothetical protein [Halovulum marinum]MSU92215.1 hypothetical protein [Halovulum marinum]